jgi:hypothetical protein
MPSRSALDVIPAKARKHVDSHVGQHENVLIVLVGQSSQTLVALDERLIIVKPGYMAGASFGAKATSFSYRDISAIEVNTTMMSGVIEVIAAGYDGRKPTRYWSSDKNQDPFKLSNCLPIAKKAASAWQEHLDVIRRKIAESKQSAALVSPSTPSASNDLVASLERLGALRSSGVLSEEEFQAAKSRLIAGNA